jgi:hypothetical protein
MALPFELTVEVGAGDDGVVDPGDHFARALGRASAPAAGKKSDDRAGHDCRADMPRPSHHRDTPH